MNSDVEQLYAAARSERTQFNDHLSRYIFMSIGMISGVDSETSLATVRTWVNEPTKVYMEYDGVEIMQPAGISCPLEGALCLLMAPRTPIQTIPEVTLLTTEEAYSNKALKAIPIVPLSTTQEYGAGTQDNGFSMYTPFGEIFVSPRGMGIKYSGEQGKSAITISPEGEITIANNATWVNLDEEGKLSVTAEGEDTTTKVEITPSSTEVKTFKLENDEETILSDIVTDEDGVMTITAAEDNVITLDADGINITDANENTIEMTSDGISITDANENTIEMSSEGIKMTGQQGSVEIQ